jgi:SAM-dependent methyltransferase
MSATANEWFKDWFDSSYYHILYNHRDDEEATFFIDHLVEFLDPAEKAEMLDLACGRGRHAVYLNKKGFFVTGVDLSPENIRFAADFSNNNLQFFVHDMRNLLCTNCFDYIFNLFTSIGYFHRKEENLKAIRNMAMALKKGGRLVIDFLNVEHIKDTASKEELKEIQGVTFHITKHIRDERVVKSIVVEDGNETFRFEENVMLLEPADFEGYFRDSALKIIGTFGSYDLQPFDVRHSDRLIYIVEKT